MALTAQRVQHLLSLRGKPRRDLPAEPRDPTAQRLQLGKVLARGGRLGDPGRHSG